VDFNTFSVRPSFKPSTAEGRKEIIRFLTDYLKLISSVEGYPCGEAPEGRFLAIFAQKYEDESTLELYRKIKKIFDPDNILNPGIKQDTDVRNTLKHFRSDYNQGIEEKQ
jgi:FAD/FMN-containing dehydrogenase